MTHIEADPSTASEKSNALIDSGKLVIKSYIIQISIMSILIKTMDDTIVKQKRNLITVHAWCFIGLVDPSELLANIEVQIVKVKEEASSRKDIMDRVDRWLSACEEENWLEEYNKVS